MAAPALQIARELSRLPPEDREQRLRLLQRDNPAQAAQVAQLLDSLLAEISRPEPEPAAAAAPK